MSTQPTPIVANSLSEAEPTISLREFGNLLRRHRDFHSMTQDTAASQVGVSRATFAQWETGRHLPAEQRVHDLDRLFRANGELVAAAELARPTSRLRPVSTAAPDDVTTHRSLLQVLNDTRRAFLDQLQFDEAGRPVGWRHNLVPSDEPPSTLSTAYGLKVLSMLGGLDAATRTVADRVLKNAVRDDDGRVLGWVTRTQSVPRLETTATALDALLHAGVPFAVAEIERTLSGLLDRTARQRPFILATALAPLLRVDPESDLANELVRALLDSRVDFDGVLLWPEKRLHRDQPLLDPSVAHTARAVTVLREAPENVVGDAVDAAEQWLISQDALGGVSEIIPRIAGDQPVEDPFHHFTSAWVARALAGASEPDRRGIANAVGQVWERYDPRLHFWAWGNGDVPVWMLGDAVSALQRSALALHTTPVPANTEPD
ncbi:MAG: helix-turn-helix domain-containing protein [Pseudonocardia sp.]